MPEFDPFEDRTADRTKREKQEQKDRSKELADVLFVMSDPAGRRFMHRLLAQTGVYRSSFAAGDPHQTSFNEGSRNVGLRQMADIMEVAAPQFAEMLEENRHAS